MERRGVVFCNRRQPCAAGVARVRAQTRPHSCYAVLLLLMIGAMLFLPTGAAQQSDDEWFNTTWEYRVGIQVETENETQRWPVERRMNFTALLHDQNDTGTFDNNSIRVFEYNDAGEIVREAPFQFDRAAGYNASTNATGELVFQLNGTTPADTTRQFFVYYDTVGADGEQKAAPSYDSALDWAWDGTDLGVDTAKFRYNLSTNRSDNVAGIYRMQEFSSAFENVIAQADPDERPVEYTEYTNGTHPFTFNFTGDVNVTGGPLRLTVTMRGEQLYFDDPDADDGLVAEKTYHFYNMSGTDVAGFVRIDHTVYNENGSAVDIAATEGGALTQDLNRTMAGSRPLQTEDEDRSEPFSYGIVNDDDRNIFSSILNLNRSDDGYFAGVFDTSGEGDPNRAGVDLPTTTVAENGSLRHAGYISPGIYLDSVGGHSDEVLAVREMFRGAPDLTIFDTEHVYAELDGDTNASIYNRNETIRLDALITDDPYNLTAAVNATLDRNDTGTNDTVALTETAPDVWNGTYDLTNESNTGRWTSNFTAFSEDDVFLGFDLHDFVVTDRYVANLTIDNDVVLEGETIYANLSVLNVREDENITGILDDPHGNITCDYGDSSVDPDNMAEVAPGTYELNFTGPSPAGEYELACNASKEGNLGTDKASFRTEVAKVNPNTTFDPESYTAVGVTAEEGENFTFVTNVTNTEEGTAYNTNLTYEHPANWTLNTTFEQCGDILPDASCTRNISVQVPNGTDPGDYDINVTTDWRNPDDTLNDTAERFNVSVQEAPVMEIVEDVVAGAVGGGYSATFGNVTIESLGNVNLTDINITCADGVPCNNFSVNTTPSNVSTLAPGENRSVRVDVGVPKDYTPGVYDGVINASSEHTFALVNLSVDVINTTTVDTVTVPDDQVTADNVTLGGNDTVAFDINSTNDGEAYAYAVNQSVDPGEPDWTVNVSQAACGERGVNASCVNPFDVTVPNGTAPGTYTVTAETVWRNPDNTTDTSTYDLDVVVASNPVQAVAEDAVNGTVAAGSYDTVGNITTLSTGNDDITDVNYSCASGTACTDFDVGFVDGPAASVAPGENTTGTVNVSVPTQYPAGNYSGTVNVSSTGGWETVDLNVEVPVTRTWELVPDPAFPDRDECITASDPNVGNVCQPLVNNTGNVPLNISVNPEDGANYTAPVPSNFSVPLDDPFQFNMTYNVTEDPESTHHAAYNVTTDADADPAWTFLNVTVFPAVEPEINVTVDPAVFEQNETTAILANVSSGTEFNITDVESTVMKPDNVTVNGSMQQIARYGNITEWRLLFPDNVSGFGANTTVRGEHLVNVTAEDEVGNAGTNQSNFTVTTGILLTFELFGDRDRLLQGDQDNLVIYSLTDVFADGLAGAEVNFSLRSDELPVPLEEDFENPYTTGDTGTLLPSFTVGSNWPADMYTMWANATWYDEAVDMERELNDQFMFPVESEGTLDVEWDPGAVWHPEANFTMWAVTSDAGRLADPDDMNLTVLDPDGNVFFRKNLSEFRRDRRGVYSTWEMIPEEDLVDYGMYWAKLELTSGGEETVEYRSFRIADEEVAKGPGPFDIRADLLQHEVEQNSALDFNLTLINKGNESGDAVVTYWVEDTEGTRYHSTQETIFTPANESLVAPRNAPIYSDQPTGDYFLYGEVEPLDGSIEPAVTNVSFRVVEENATEFEEPDPIVREETEDRVVPPEEEGEEVATNVSIIGAPQEINVVRGDVAKVQVTAANTGDTALNNVSLSMLGVPPDWIAVTPEVVDEIALDATETFMVDVTPPDNTDLGTRNATFLLTARRTGDRQPVTVNVFESLESKIQADIDRLEDRLAELRDERDRLAEQGANVDNLDAVITEIEAAITDAESSLDDGDMEGALNSIATADGRVSEAEQIADRLDVPAREDAFELAPMVLAALLLLATVLVVFYAVKVRNAAPLDAVRQRMHRVLLDLKRKRRQEKQELVEEKQKTKRLLDLLEAQHEEGIMDDETYEELKMSAEEKLVRINSELED